MQITKEWLIEKEACEEGLNWFLNQSETNLYQLIDKLIKENHKDWANWLIVRAMNRQQQLQYAIACAELALPIFEEKYPSDTRPRLAIEATKRVLKDDSKENRDAASAATEAADEARAASAAAHAAYAAWEAAGVATDAAYAAYAAYAAWATAEAASWEQVIRIGINILKGNN